MYIKKGCLIKDNLTLKEKILFNTLSFATEGNR